MPASQQGLAVAATPCHARVPNTACCGVRSRPSIFKHFLSTDQVEPLPLRSVEIQIQPVVRRRIRAALSSRSVCRSNARFYESESTESRTECVTNALAENVIGRDPLLLPDMATNESTDFQLPDGFNRRKGHVGRQITHQPPNVLPRPLLAPVPQLEGRGSLERTMVMPRASTRDSSRLKRRIQQSFLISSDPSPCGPRRSCQGTPRQVARSRPRRCVRERTHEPVVRGLQEASRPDTRWLGVAADGTRGTHLDSRIRGPRDHPVAWALGGRRSASYACQTDHCRLPTSEGPPDRPWSIG